MATDTQAQRTRIFKDLFCKGIKYGIMTGDSIAHALAVESNNSNYIFRSEINQYLFNQSLAGSNLAKFVGGTTENPLSIVGKSETNYFDVKNCDYLFCWAGYNDFNDNTPLGATNSNDSFTISGAIRNTVANYALINPSMQLIWITPNNNPYLTSADSHGVFFDELCAHIKDTCDANGFICYDGLSDPLISGINDGNKATILPDQIHPIASWHETVSAIKIAEFALSVI